MQRRTGSDEESAMHDPSPARFRRIIDDGRVQIQLRSIGARSGKRRTATLYAWEDGDDLVIVGSRGGAARNPAWVHNLRANPRASVSAGKRTWDVDAHEVPDGTKRDRLWALVVERFPLYATYQQRTKRRIPLIVLTPAAAE
jgi:deazaflavin-dependent oxidoreductase (nitroreductase family)